MKFLKGQRGEIAAPLMKLIGGLCCFVVGLILSGIVISTAATSGAAAGIGSFTGRMAPLRRKLEMLRRQSRGTLNWSCQHGNPEPSRIPQGIRACVETGRLPAFAMCKVEGTVLSQPKGWGR